MRDSWRLVFFLLRPSPEVPAAGRRMALVLLGAGAGGAISIGLVALINRALVRGLDPALIWTFIAFSVLLPVTRYGSQVLLIRLSQQTVLSLRLRLARRILGAPLRLLETIGPHRILATLTEDVTNVREIAILIPLLCMQVTVVAGCLVYLGWLSWRLLLLVAAVLIAGVAGYRLAIQQGRVYFLRVREAMDRLIGRFRGLAEGVKELKLHQPRRRAFLSRLHGEALAIQEDTMAANQTFALANSVGQMLGFALIALLFVLHRNIGFLSGPALVSAVLVVLYIRTPLDASLQMLPTFHRAGVSLAKIEELGLALAAVSLGPGREAPDREGPDREAPGREAAAAPAGDAGAGRWQRLDLLGVTHAYTREGDESSFTLGPIDLALRPGELLFLVGGNGSGKTTLAKLILGLYPPESGEVRLDGRRVGESERESYMQHFTAVFSDFFLFDDLLGLEHDPELEAQARRYLGVLQLERKVKVADGRLSTTDLSQGQRKRLALLTAYLEDRPIYLFDEWAADQDPHFKEIFYLELLPGLKARGKTVISISHDDRYYRLADRIVKMEDGQITYDGDYQGYQALGLAPAAAHQPHGG